MSDNCVICGQGHDDQDEVRQGDGTWYHEECLWSGESGDSGEEL